MVPQHLYILKQYFVLEDFSISFDFNETYTPQVLRIIKYMSFASFHQNWIQMKNERTKVVLLAI